MAARRPRRTRLLVAALSLLAVAGGALSACGGGGGTTGAPDPTTAAGQRGKALWDAKGCKACHTVNGGKAVGPTWKDLAGSEVKLSGGQTVTADDDYLARSITDPRSEVVEGFANMMPENDLSGSEVRDVIAYLNELSTKD